MAHVLIIEDEKDLAAGLRDNLEFEKHTVTHAATGAEATHALAQRLPDLILLDLMLPDADGFDLCKRFRDAGHTMPIIILSARGQEIDKVRGLELGADDYVTKPFSLRELLARVSAALRRSAPAGAPGSTESFRIGDRTVDLRRQKVIAGREELPLGYYESEILRMLHQNAGQAVSRADLLERIWGAGVYPADRTVDNHIVSLRRKLEPDPKKPKHILTAHAVGYKLVV